MNGNQALGFARVRYVMRDGECGDFARTLRHRTVMTALYKRVIDKSTLELVAMIPKILPMLTTNIKKEDLVNYIAMAVQVRDQNKKIYTLNVPVEGGIRSLVPERCRSFCRIRCLRVSIKCRSLFMVVHSQPRGKKKRVPILRLVSKNA